MFLFFKADFSVFCIEEFLKQKGKISDINSFLVYVYFLPETAPRRMYICKITNTVELFKKRWNDRCKLSFQVLELLLDAKQ